MLRMITSSAIVFRSLISDSLDTVKVFSFFSVVSGWHCPYSPIAPMSG